MSRTTIDPKVKKTFSLNKKTVDSLNELTKLMNHYNASLTLRVLIEKEIKILKEQE